MPYFIHKGIVLPLVCCIPPSLRPLSFPFPPLPLSYPYPSPTSPFSVTYPAFFLSSCPVAVLPLLRLTPTFPNLPIHPYPINPFPSFYLQSHPFLSSPPALCNPYRESPVSRGSPYFHNAARGVATCQITTMQIRFSSY
jgi:hypothetical protein